jgi:hypothetical protein
MPDPKVVDRAPDEEMAREVAELWAEVTRMQAEAARRAAAPIGRRRGRSSRGDAPSEPQSVSRRRLFGLLGGAAAAGAGLAVAGSTLGAEPADATTGNMQFGAINDAGNAPTYLTGTGSPTLQVTSTGDNTPLLVYATPGAAAQAADFYGAAGRSVIRLRPDTGASAPPIVGQQGEVWVNGNALVTELWYCVTGAVGGPNPHPSAWVKLSSVLNRLPSPVRVYDSRQGHSSGVPSGASAVLGNITVTGTGAAAYLTVYPNGVSQPATSNVNAFGAGQTIANSFTSTVGNSNQISITCGGGPTDFIIDIFGYYL